MTKSHTTKKLGTILRRNLAENEAQRTSLRNRGLKGELTTFFNKVTAAIPDELQTRALSAKGADANTASNLAQFAYSQDLTRDYTLSKADNSLIKALPAFKKLDRACQKMGIDFRISTKFGIETRSFYPNFGAEFSTIQIEVDAGKPHNAKSASITHEKVDRTAARDE